MEYVQDGTVYLGLSEDFTHSENTAARWTGHYESGDRSQFEVGPDFMDASDAVSWWRRRGVKRIVIRLDFEEYLWAGEESPPDDCSTLSVFDPTDPRGRPEGAMRTLQTRRQDLELDKSAERVAAALDEGRRLTRRREEIGLSVDELADRVGQSTGWLRGVESGTLTHDVTPPQWLSLVWATRHGWPEEMRSSDIGDMGWVAQRGQCLRAAEDFVNKMCGYYD